MDPEQSQIGPIPKDGYRLQSKGFFLTWPKCPVAKSVVADMLATKGTIIKGLIG